MIAQSYCDDSGIDEGEDNVPRRGLAHCLIEGIPRIIGVTLRRPKVPATQFLAVGPILVDPPVTHVAGKLVYRLFIAFIWAF